MQRDPLGLTEPYPVADALEIFQGAASREVVFEKATRNR
ncbi:hypothetical protein FHR32_007090 [Streptosporangium album]|uniref:Uncharacterized protein n=1 Tax=Streptosporangium album TaxID=47479 RepID=A0A7W7WDT4_9ACTN|nr:hypothetical protein [Streptosporangium album]